MSVKNFLNRCNKGWANYNPEKDKTKTTVKDLNLKYCNYKQKAQLTAFLLEFFLPFGSGHFYALRYLSGVFKLLIFFGFWIGYCVINSMKKGGLSWVDESLNMKVAGCFLCCLCMGILAWQITDIVLFSTNSYKDGNGAPLNSW